jgi:hypothetical protein
MVEPDSSALDRMGMLGRMPPLGRERSRGAGIRCPLRAIVTAGVLLGLVAPAGAHPDGAPVPGHVDEELSYRAVSSRFGTIGTGTLSVTAADAIRGHAVIRLGFVFRGRVGPFRVSDETYSWITSGEMRSVRYRKEERSPLGARTERVEIFPGERRWQAFGGASGDTPTADPLDELSILYYLRTLPLKDGDSYTLTRHFDQARNPVRVQVLRRERTVVPAGEFATVVVEMRVRDSRVFRGDGTLRLSLTDDEDRIPVRIASTAPWLGSTEMLLVRSR